MFTLIEFDFFNKLYENIIIEIIFFNFFINGTDNQQNFQTKCIKNNKC